MDKVKKRNRTIGREGECFHRVDGADCVAPLAFVAYASLEKSFEAQGMAMRIMMDDFHGDNDDADVKWRCHLCEEIGTVSKSIVLPVEIADAGPISCLKTFSDTFVGHSFISNDDMNHNSDGSNVTFQSLEPSSALTPSQMVFPLFCFALHTLNNSHAIKLNTFKFWSYVSKKIMLIV